MMHIYIVISVTCILWFGSIVCLVRVEKTARHKIKEKTSIRVALGKTKLHKSQNTAPHEISSLLYVV